MAIKTEKREMQHEAIHAIREKIEKLHFYAKKGDLQMCRMTLAELIAYNELLNKIGIYNEDKKRLMSRIIKNYTPNLKHILINRLKGGIFS